MSCFKRNNNYIQGIFIPTNKAKYIGSKAIYRSSLELKFFKFCDNNPNVLKWGSENIVIPYYNPLDKKMHRYFVDNYVVIKEGEQIKKYLIEIKPSSALIKPTISKNKRKSTIIYEQTMYIQNQCKWGAAKEYCTKHSLEFLILTEKELTGYK